MASSICRSLLLSKCVRLHSISPRNLSSFGLRLRTVTSGSLLINNSAILQTAASGCGRRWCSNLNKPVEPQPPPQPPKPSVSEEDAKREEEKRKAANKQWKYTKYSLIGLALIFTCSTGFILVVWGSPQTDRHGNPIEDEYSEMPVAKAYLYRAWNELLFYNKMIQEPSREKLLPDPLKEPFYQPPYTLVLEMTDVLVHPDWTYKTGWRFKKRPGVDFFLQQVGPPLFEVVIYTSEQGFTAFPLLDSLDPNGFIMYRLFRDATRYLNGHHVKDLSCLNRDLSKVIMVDWNEKSVQLQPENALRLKKWSGNDDDSTLYDLAIFLRTITGNEVEDVRSVLQFYQQFDDPIAAFKENQKRLQEEQDKRTQLQAATGDRPTSLASSWTSGLFGRRR